MGRSRKGVIKTTCSKCGNELNPNRINKYRYCLDCHNAYMRANRKKYCELSKEDKKKGIARSKMKVYLKRGKLMKHECEVCGNHKSEGHHEDYSKPLEVIWLCKACHINHHKAKEKKPMVELAQMELAY